MTKYRDLNVPLRTIMTPGPVEVDPRVLRAMATPILGQFDPAFTNIMNETMEMLRAVFQTDNQWAFPVDGTSRAGIEAVLCSLIEPGDKVLIPIYGRFGYLLTEICQRYGADVTTMEVPWGEVFDPEDVINKIHEVSPKIVAIVHAETSTSCMQPLKEIGEACRNADILLVVDAVASLGGVDLKVDELKLDAVIGGTQKCLSVPSGLAPITFNDRVEAVINKRKSIELGLKTAQSEFSNNRIISNYFDLAQLQDYWSPTRLNHHTEATSMQYALREGLRIILEEGLENRFARHKLNEKALVAGIKAMGLELFGDEKHKLPVVTAIEIPAGIDGEEVRALMLEDFEVEIASSFGPLHGKIWRIGTMGYSSRKKNILHVLAALEGTLIRKGFNVNRGESLQAALDVYDEIKNLVTV
ncbi:alanine--glyoxylate aminotransferase family protein [Lysinibacillus yapensis]|uniref:Alanine--glyoxylate aminotransferase family protein n=1 Tax=Ureibacillus yapensis TaxID=2304605 RepID=A0A396S3H1_9BACL|nr:alanine--glyoxylate aminotransferase family protein [Lysinibacillus yapensis]RHW32064.1 alanine--glyoxylate aminotransferase family protein [Lysinibacillus yapensis]